MTDGTYKDILISHPAGQGILHSREVVEPIGGRFKHNFDLMLGLVALVVLFPLLVAIWLLVRLFDGGPAIVRHQRMGYGAQEFECLKFRTMVLNSDQVLCEYLKNNSKAAEEWATKQKLAKDPRVTRLGWFLRQTSLDELPQLWNVLRGEMSLVGPRPVTFGEIKRYGAAAFDYYRARPGISGLWQVSGRSKLPYETRVELDKAYVRTWSIWKDLRILGKTLPCLFDPEASV